MAVYDLTRSLSPETAVYPGDPPVRFHHHLQYTEDGCRVSTVQLGTHAGTHLDAPSHFLPEGLTVDRLPLAALLGPARLVNVLDPLGEFGPGERILVRTGWGEHWGQADYFSGFPGLPAGFAEALAAAPAALVGLETPSLHPDPEEDVRLHRLLLGAGVIIVENLAGLERLPDEVHLCALPLPLEGLDGSPCRVVAWSGEPG